MRVSREISLGSSLHRASTDALITKSGKMPKGSLNCIASMYTLAVLQKKK